MKTRQLVGGRFHVPDGESKKLGKSSVIFGSFSAHQRKDSTILWTTYSSNIGFATIHDLPSLYELTNLHKPVEFVLD